MSNEIDLLEKILNNSEIANSVLSQVNYDDKKYLIEQLINRMKEKISSMDRNTFDIKLIISWYDSILSEYFINDDIYMIYNDPLIKLIQSKISLYNIDPEEYINMIVNLQSSITNDIKIKCLKNYKTKKENMNNEEFKRYVYALNELDEYSEDDYYFIFNMLLDKKYIISDEEYIKFIIKFTKFQLKIFNIENIEVTVKNMLENGYYINNKDKQSIILNKNYVQLTNILTNLKTIFHEIKHAIQHKDEKELYRIDAIKMIEDRIIREHILKDNEYYKENYENISFENDANICARIYLLEFLKKCAPITYETINNEIKEELKKYNSISTNNNRQTMFGDYDLQILFSKLFKNNKDIIYEKLSVNEKIILFQVFDTNGNPKTVDNYFKAKEKILYKISILSSNEMSEIEKLQSKLEFYDSILLTFKYSIEDQIRNLQSLENYKTDNPNIKREIEEYIAKIKMELKIYEQTIKSGGHK